MKTVFSNISIGDTFNTGIFDATFPYTGKTFMEYRKISKSSAMCINQVGYGNTRAINSVTSFSAFSIIYK